MKDMKIFKNKNLVDGVFFLLISIFFIKESLKLHTNASWALSPALFPLIVMSLLLVFSLGLIVSSLVVRDKDVDVSEKAKEGNNRKVILKKYYKLIGFIALTIVYIVVLPKIHFLISSILYLFSLMILLGERNIKMLILISVITPIIVQYIFGNLLDVYLP